MIKGALLPRFTVVLSLIALLAVALPVGNVWAGPVPALQATIIVQIWDLGLDFGAVGPWEAALYAVAVDSQETSGRLTHWIPAEDVRATLHIPESVMEDVELPWWDETQSVYVRVRTMSDGVYPILDLVSEPFTLEPSLYTVDIGIEQRPTPRPAEPGHVEVALGDRSGEFGAPGAWEAALYTWPTVGAETEGRFTPWIASPNGMILISPQTDLLQGMTPPWDEEEQTYVRIRTVDESYPILDIVSRPFTLTEGEIMNLFFVLTRSVRDERPSLIGPPVEGVSYRTYIVQPGDTLWGIARRELSKGPRYDEIVALTNLAAETDHRIATIDNPDLVLVGWTIAIPEIQAGP